MKKKFVLFVAVVLIAVATCVSLVACTSVTPDDFMTKWLSAEKKTVVTNTIERHDNEYDGYEFIPVERTYLFDGSLIKITTTKTETDSEGKETKMTKTEIYEISGNNVNFYTCYPTDDGNGEWEAYCEEIEEDYNATISRMFQQLVDYHEAVTELDNEMFKKDFVKKEGWYVAKYPYKAYGYVGIKFEKDALLIKNDIDSKIDFNAKYAIGCDAISIPAEAKTALEEYKSSLAE